MDKQDLQNKIMQGVKNSLNESLNESKAFDPKNNKQHKEAYNSFVKWYNRWKEKLGREEIRGLVRKVTNDALGDNLNTINETYIARIEDADETLAHDLFLVFENVERLCKMVQPMVDNLVRRLRKGQEPSLDILANSSVMQHYVREVIDYYKREYATDRMHIDTATRKALKVKMAKRIINQAQDNFDYEQRNNNIE